MASGRTKHSKSLEFCFEHNIILCRLPSHTYHKLQPCDVAVFSSLKAAYRDQTDRLERGVNTIGKQHFTSLFSPARKIAFTPKNIKAGFAASGLFPFNPDRVLRHMPKPPDDLPIQRADEANVGSCPQDDVVPQTLKFTKAGQQLLVKGALKDDQIQFLSTINNEAKVRRKTQSLVLGKAKVMSFEDLEEARAKRAEKDAAKEAKGKGKRGRKRKSDTLEAEEDTVKTARRGRKRKSPALIASELTNRIGRIPTGASITQTSGTQVAEDEVVPEPWIAPMARMY